MNETIEPEWFTAESDKIKNPDKPRRFKIRGLDSLEALDVITHTYVENGEIYANGSALKAAVRNGIIDWENHNDAEGKPIEHSRANLITVDPLALLQVGKQIIGKTNLTGEEIKN